MLFWLACEEFSKETNKGDIQEKARLIYEDYVSILSPKEVWKIYCRPHFLMNICKMLFVKSAFLSFSFIILSLSLSLSYR